MSTTPAASLTLHRQSLECGASSIAATLGVASDLLVAMVSANPPPYATQGSVGALIECARLSAQMMDMQMEGVYAALDAAATT